MIDLLGLAQSLSRMFPKESADLADALSDAVIYKNKSAENLGGLAVYFPFANKENLEENVAIYTGVNRLPVYSEFIGEFASMLTRPPALSSWRGASVNNFRIPPHERDYIANITSTLWFDVTKHDDYSGAVWQIQIAEGGAAEIDRDGNVSMVPAALITLNTLQGNRNGHPVCLYSFNGDGQNRYAIPIRLNGGDANIIVAESDNELRILGAVPTGNGVLNMLDKKMVEITDGDVIAVRYYAVPKEADDLADEKKRGNMVCGLKPHRARRTVA
jgi:hypothetical protein